MPGLPSSINLDECISELYSKRLLSEPLIEAICAKAKEMLMKESNVVHISAPVTVVGDIHGQFFDMLEIFKIGGFCPDTNYLFLGMSTGWLYALLIHDQEIMSIVGCSVLRQFLFLSV